MCDIESRKILTPELGFESSKYSRVMKNTMTFMEYREMVDRFRKDPAGEIKRPEVFQFMSLFMFNNYKLESSHDEIRKEERREKSKESKPKNKK